MIETTTRAYEDILGNTSLLPGKNVTERITNQDRVLQVDRVLGGSLQDQPRFWLAAAAVILRGMGAHEDPIYPAARRLDFRNQPVIDLASSVLADQAPANRRLVGDHQDLKMTALDFNQCIEGLGINSYVRPGANIIRSIFDNHSIPVQE